MNKERLITLSIFILIAAAARLLPHAPNVTPIAAIALFAGAHFDKKWMAFVVPLTAMLVSDAYIGFHSNMLAVYLAFIGTVIIGFIIRSKYSVSMIATGALASSVLFFVVTNFAVWMSGQLYPLTFTGLQACFIAAVPFFANTLVGTLFYTALLFRGFTIARKRYSVLALKETA